MPQKEGYLLIDHTASPGVPEWMARIAGVDPALVAEGKRLESATLTCKHCKSTVVKNPFRKLERAKCAKCSFVYICDICAFEASLPDYDHTPYEKKVDLILSGKGETLGSPQKLILPT